METKKNPRKDLTQDSGLHFVTGLVIILMLTYVTLEWKTFNSEYISCSTVMINDDNITEEPVFFKLSTPPKPKPVITPPFIDIAVNETEIPETPFEVIDPNPNTVIADVGDIDVPEKVLYEDIDFINVEQVPIFPGCEKNEDKRACFNEKIKTHVRKNFRYPEIAQEMGIQGKVYIRFVIQKDGSIGNLQLRGPDENLKAEASRIVDKLPKMTPGKQRGTAVRVPFNLPLTFKLD